VDTGLDTAVRQPRGYRTHCCRVSVGECAGHSHYTVSFRTVRLERHM